jgi:hypothetical protein
MGEKQLTQQSYTNQVVDLIEELNKLTTEALENNIEVRDIVMKSVALLVEVATQDSTNIYEGVLLLEEAKKDIIEDL